MSNKPSVATIHRGEALNVNGDTEKPIQLYTIQLNGVSVELCSLGASITRFCVPRKDSGGGTDDVVLGFGDTKEMYETKNPPYFSVIAGRVANRIEKGRFQIQSDGPVYQLDTNNGPNHLHGGLKGFSHCSWDSEIVGAEEGKVRAVRFSLLSPAGDQGYPGTLQVSATYSLHPNTEPSSRDSAVRLSLALEAELVEGTPTPVSLTQHSYFCLAGHQSEQGNLDHTLRLNCDAYTPVDDALIPTKEVRKVADDPAMDWTKTRSLRQALIDYGVEKVGLSGDQVEADLNHRGAPLKSGPYGFDHNYVVRDGNREGLKVVAILEHSSAKRRLTVRSTQPGVQLYSGNFLDNTVPGSMKDSASTTGYSRWQSICLEPQHFPDSVGIDAEKYPDYAAGKCPILTPESPKYQEQIEYTLEF